MICTNDDYGARAERDDALAESFVSTESRTDADVIETEEGTNFEGKPTATDVVCDECGAGEAWDTIKQTGSADSGLQLSGRPERD